MKLEIELIYDADCPNVDAARAQLQVALQRCELPLQWQEWNRVDSSAPQYVRRYGSPTILVNRKDVVEAETASDNCCRIYAAHEGGFAGAPSVEVIIAGIQREIKPTFA